MNKETDFTCAETQHERPPFFVACPPAGLSDQSPPVEVKTDLDMAEYLEHQLESPSSSA